jgi:exonuclease III
MALWANGISSTIKMADYTTVNSQPLMCSTTNTRIKLVNQNCQGLKGNNKKRKLATWLDKKHYDIVTIQEAHIEKKDLDEWKDVWKGKILYSCGSNNSRGVVTLISEHTDCEVIKQENDNEGRWIVAHIQLKGLEFIIGNYYGPNDDNPEHLRSMTEKIDEIGIDRIIIAGDFNMVQNIHLDKHGGNLKTNFKCQREIQSWMETNEVSDIWRIKNPTTRKYTWISNTTPKIMTRIDYFLMSDNLQGLYKDTNIIPGYMTDHSCTTLVIELPDTNRGKGLWKFNSTLTKNQTLKNQIRETIKNTVSDNPNTNDGLLWDVLKCQMRGTCISFASHKNKQEKCRFQQIEKEIMKGEEMKQNQIANNINIEEINEKLETLSYELNQIIEEKTMGCALRSKVSWYEEGDRSSKLFLNLEKSKGEAKTIRKLKTESGKVVTDLKNILEEQERFYHNLYKKPPQHLNHHSRETEKEIWNTQGPSISDDQWDDLTKPIEENEIWDIIKDSPLNKSPGTDGLTTEFYKEYWPLIKPYLIDSLNYGLNRGELNISQKRGVISLIPKPQKDLEELKNWRPITLLNQDYKYLTKALAIRLEKTLDNIISSDQSGFVKGRYIGCNLQRTQNLIELCKEENINGSLINIDFEKAFDTISWEFISKALKKLNYPPKFISWISTLYKEIETCVINNGHTTTFFKPERGVRQGCPISPYLFIISSEIMNRWLKVKLEDHGIIDNKGINYFITQFADDTSFSIVNNKNAMHDLFYHLNEYGLISGLKLNINKTEILPLGTSNETDIPKRYRRHVKEEVKYLGCTIKKDYKETTNINIKEASIKIDNLISKWIHRKTTLSGKIAIIKSLLLPQLTYILTNMNSPDDKTIQEIDKKLYKFMNNGGSEKIKRTILIGNYDEGGYKMTDLQSYTKAIKMNWITRLCSIDGVWKQYIINKMKVNIEYMARCNIKYKDLPFRFPKKSMWDEIWQLWCEENYKEVKTTEDILNQNLWYNSHIKSNKKVLYWKNWDEADIRWVADLIFENDEGVKRFFDKKELEEMGINNLTQMQYNIMISAIPKPWRVELKADNIIEETQEDYKLLDTLLDSKKPMRKIYTMLVKRKATKPNKWKNETGSMASEAEILVEHRERHWCTLNNKIRSFNCNWLNRNIPYNRKLHHMKKKDSPKCAHCDEEETLLHLYWQCPDRIKLWEKAGEIVKEITGKELQINKESCLLYTVNQPKKDEQNIENEIQRIIALLVKYFIHINKCNEDKNPSTNGLKGFIKHHLNMERICAERKGKINRYLEIWREWIPWLDGQLIID